MQVIVTILAFAVVGLLSYASVVSLMAQDFSNSAILVYTALLAIITGAVNRVVVHRQYREQANAFLSQMSQGVQDGYAREDVFKKDIH